VLKRGTFDERLVKEESRALARVLR
jgi:hypothetical protein